MNEIIPPSEPGKEPPKPIPTEVYDKSNPPSKKACAALGCLLLILSTALCYVTPFFGLFGFVVAFACLFRPWYDRR
jgi:hypothetical protein